MHFMKTIIITAALFTLASSCRPHKRIDRDKLVAEICQSFKDDERIDEPDETKIKRIVYAHLDKYTIGMPNDSLNALVDFIDIRLQRECREYRDIAYRMNKKDIKNNWRDVDLEPETFVSKKECDAFFGAGQLKYLEADGDTTVVDISDTSWTDHFADGTYSHLSLKRMRPEEFILTFLESDNTIRKNMSHPGDQYRYKIIKKEGSSYSMFVEVVGPGLRSLFKMFY